MVANRRSSLFDNVDPRLAKLIESFKYDKYGVTPTSGYRPGDKRQHGGGTAMDVQLTDPKSGAALANYQDPSTFGAYQEYANALYQHALQTDPELAKQMRWGGYFSGPKGKYGALDLMHFDVGGGAMGGGSWEGGLNPEQAKLWGLQAGGGVGGAGGAQQGPTAGTQVVQYSPEQRRNAIASIESAGSGDYKALGPRIGGPQGGDRAYGRYQIMGKNIPIWSQEVLGRTVTPEEFMADPKIQDAIFDKKFGDYVAKHGEENAAQAWFGGEGSIGKVDLKDALGTNVGGYGRKYIEALGVAKGDTSNPGAETYQPGGSGAPTDPVTTAGVDDKDKKPSWGDTLGDMFSGMGSIAGGGKDGLPKIQPLKQLQAPANVTTQGGPLASADQSNQLRQQFAQRLAELQRGTPQGPSGNPWRLY
jgi:hypothetical protein